MPSAASDVRARMEQLLDQYTLDQVYGHTLGELVSRDVYTAEEQAAFAEAIFDRPKMRISLQKLAQAAISTMSFTFTPAQMAQIAPALVDPEREVDILLTSVQAAQLQAARQRRQYEEAGAEMNAAEFDAHASQEQSQKSTDQPIGGRWKQVRHENFDSLEEADAFLREQGDSLDHYTLANRETFDQMLRAREAEIDHELSCDE